MIPGRRLAVDFGQFWLAPFGTYPVLDSQREPTPVQRLDGFAESGTSWLLEVAVDGAGIIVATGIRSGPVWVTVGDDLGAPPEGAGHWQERAALVVDVTEELMVSSGHVWQEPLRVPAEPGPHRVTVLATGRGLHRHHAIAGTNDPVEEYLVVIEPV